MLAVFAIFAAGLGAAAQFGKISVAYPLLSEAYAAHAGVGIGVMVSIVGVVGLILGTTAGLLIERTGPARAILAALLLGAVVSALQSFLPPYPVMIQLRVLEGVSHLAIVVVGPLAMVAAAPPRHQGIAMMLWATFFGLTYAILAYVGPPIMAVGGIALLFRLHALWMAGCALVLWRLLPADPPIKANPMSVGILAQHRAIYTSPYIAAPAMGFFCYTISFVAILTVLPQAIAPQWRGIAAIGMPLMSMGVAVTLGTFLLRRMSAVDLAQVSFGATMLCSIGLWAFWGQGQGEIIAALLLAAALGVVPGASFAAIPQLNSDLEGRVRASGAIAQLGNLGTTTGTPILEFLMEKAGEAGLSLFVIGFSAFGIALHQWQARRRISA